MKVVFSRRLRKCAALAALLAWAVASPSAFSAGPSFADQSASGSSPSARTDTLVVFPFENTVHDAQSDWLGEGLAELIADQMTGRSATVFSRDERLAALEKLGLPAYTQFSRATMLKIAAEIDADYVVFGQFSPGEKTIQVTVRMLRVNPPRLSAPLTESGAMDTLGEIQARLSWQLLCQMENSLDAKAACDTSSPAAQHFMAGAPHLRPDAFEFLVRGLVASDDESRLRNLREASRLDPSWDDPLFAIGQTYYARRDCEAALGWFARVPGSSPHATQAWFDTGVCQLLRNDPQHAESMFSALIGRAGSTSQGSVTPGVLSNLGTAMLRQTRYKEAATNFERAEQLDPGEPDYWFNVGLANYLLGDWAKAASSFREAARLQPDSIEARALLLAALDQNGDSEEANALRQDISPADAKTDMMDIRPNVKQQDVTKMNATALARLARVRMGLNTGAVR